MNIPGKNLIKSALAMPIHYATSHSKAPLHMSKWLSKRFVCTVETGTGLVVDSM